MAKTKTKGTAKTVGDTPVPQPITISSTNPKIMADNIKKLEKAIKGADDASEISYDNTTSHLTASNVQAAIDEVVTEIGSITAPAASDVTYDNTSSGLTADDVQEAIDEVVTTIKTFDTLLNTALTTESTEYPLTHDKRDYKLITIAVAWAGGANSNFITLPPTEIYNGSTRIYLNGDTTSDYATISVFANTSITALASNSNVHVRIYGIM